MEKVSVGEWLAGPCTNHGSRQQAADESRGALCHLEAGTRIVAADSIRNLGQEDQAAVMPHRHPRQTTSRNGYCANHRGYHKGRTPARRTCKSTPPMRCGESFRRRWPRYLECRGWICQETLCDRSSVIFDLRQCALKTFIDGVATARHGTGNRPDILCRRR